jgi:hypothetical protein
MDKDSWMLFFYIKEKINDSQSNAPDFKRCKTA